MANKHALLSASSAHRWLECPPSAKATEGIEDVTSDYALEGTDAHALCEFKLKKLLAMECANPTDTLKFYNAEMEECATDYANYVGEKLEDIKKDCKDPVILIEQKLDFSKYVPEGYGYGDAVIVADKTLHVIDFKFGRGIEISANQNPQMFLYALGGLALFDGIYDVNTIKLSIFQPRIGNVSEYEISKEDLLSWANETLVPIAKLAYEGKGEFKAGEHCRFCKLKATCRKRAEYNLELAKYDFKMPDNLLNEEIVAILDRADKFSDWLNDIKDYALTKALNGEKFEGYKVVAGRSVRKYLDEDKVASIVTDLGLDPYEKKLLGITAMSQLLGKSKFESLLGGLIYKPPGKPTLVKADDRREEIESAKETFKNL